jgi:hypothetical protein
MAILTNQEAAELLGYTAPEEMPGKVTSIFLPGAEGYVKEATGKDWGADTPVDPVAKMAVGVLLIRWFENPEEVGKATGTGIIGLVTQLSAKYQLELQSL